MHVSLRTFAETEAFFRKCRLYVRVTCCYIIAYVRACRTVKRRTKRKQNVRFTRTNVYLFSHNIRYAQRSVFMGKSFGGTTRLYNNNIIYHDYHIRACFVPHRFIFVYDNTHTHLYIYIFYKILIVVILFFLRGFRACDSRTPNRALVRCGSYSHRSCYIIQCVSDSERRAYCFHSDIFVFSSTTF